MKPLAILEHSDREILIKSLSDHVHATVYIQLGLDICRFLFF